MCGGGEDEEKEGEHYYNQGLFMSKDCILTFYFFLDFMG
jgi:hypothetical protein